MYNLPKGYKGTLIADFDCTKKYDSNTFFATEGTHITDSPMGKYLETSNDAMSRFGYRFSLKHANKPHMMVISYPDDKNRHMMINDCFSYDMSTGVFCGGEYEITNTAKEIYNIFWPRTTDMTVTFTTWGKNEPSAVFGFTVYELEELSLQNMKEISYPTRKFGVQYEDPCGSISDLGAITIEEWGDKFIEYAKHTGQNMLVYPINWYCGPNFNSKTQPGSLYYWMSLPNRQQYSIASSKPDDWISPLLDKCEEAGVDFIGGMTLLRLGNLLKNMNIDLNSIVEGKDTYNNMRCDNGVQASTNDWTPIYNPLNYEKMIAEGRKVESIENFEFIYGEKKDNFGGAPIFNPIHPEVQRQLVEYFEEISEKYGNKKAFKGVQVNIWHATILWYSSLMIGYDDYTVNLFTKETGIKVSCKKNDPDRFKKRYEFLNRRNRQLWISWRCKKIHELILKLRDALRKYNPSLKLYLCMWNEPVKLGMFGTFNEEQQYLMFDESVQYPAFANEYDFLREGGIDLELFKDDEGISMSMEQNQHRDRGWTMQGSELPEEHRHFFHDLAYLDKSWSDNIREMKSCGAYVMDSWEEAWGKNIKMPFNEHNPDIDEALKNFKFENITFNENTCKPINEDGFWFESQRQITSCFPTGRNYLEPFAHAVAELDPMYMVRGGLYLDKSHAIEASEYSSVFTKLPAVKFKTVKGAGEPVVVRELNIEDNYFFYAVNREPYSVVVRVVLKKEGKFKNLRTSEIIESKNSEIEFVLPAFSIEGFTANSTNKVVSYTAIVPQTEEEKIKMLYKKQIEVFKKLEESEYSIAGAELIKNQLETAYKNNEISKVRHLLKSYVSSKTRKMFE